MADGELVVLLLGGLVWVALGVSRFPALRLPVSWSGSTVLVLLAVVVPQALPFVPWQPWCLVAALVGLLGICVTLVLMYHWVLQGKVLTLPPGTPPLFPAFLLGISLSAYSTVSCPVPLWIGLALDLNAVLIVVLLFVWMRMSPRRAQLAQQKSGTGSVS